MVERVARALCTLDIPNGSPDDMFGSKPRWVHYVPAAMTAIEAMREPTPSILKALLENVPVSGYEWEDDEPAAPDCWRACIDAALKEGQ
jgi:hypothetical protein